MSYKSVVVFALLLVSLMAVCPGLEAEIAAAGDNKPAEVAFKYSPPVPITLLEQVTTRRTTLAAGMDAAEEVSVSKVKTRIEHEGDGFVINTEPASFDITRDGKTVKDPIVDVLQATKVTYHVDAEGKLKQIDGYKGVLDAASKVAPKALRDTLKMLMSEEALTVRETAQWNSRIGDLTGQKGRKNAVWLGDGVWPLPDGTMAHYYIITMFSGFVDRDGRKLAKLDLLFEIDQNKIRQRVNDLARDVVEGIPTPKALAKVPGFVITGKGERLIDPATMLTYSEKAQRDVTWMMKMGKDGDVKVLVLETKEYKVDYGTR